MGVSCCDFYLVGFATCACLLQQSRFRVVSKLCVINPNTGLKMWNITLTEADTHKLTLFRENFGVDVNAETNVEHSLTVGNVTKCVSP
jgi:hypothetical protein